MEMLTFRQETLNGKWVKLCERRCSQCKLNGGESIEMALPWNMFRLF